MISTDYSETDMNLQKIAEELNNPDAIGLVKGVLEKIG